MRTLPLDQVRARLDDLVDTGSVTSEKVTITRNGTPVAVLVGAHEWESLQETLFWLSQPGIHEALAAADADVAAGCTVDEDELRAEFGLPRQT